MNFRRKICVLLLMVLAVSALPAFDVTAFAKSMPYRISVDITNQIVTIYDNETDEIVRQCLCTTGAKDATPLGTYTMPPKEEDDERTEWYYFRGFHVYARYASRVYKGIMFHSLIYNKRSMSSLAQSSVKEYGRPASHGCIRLRWQDAEFIAKQCKPGTKVKIYKSGERDDELRALLFQSSYTNENGMTYNQYWGVPDEPGAMGRASEGDEVKGLQMRLRDLGIYNDEINGIYRGATVVAVKDAQAMLGMEQTGVATMAFQNAILSSDAPSAMNVMLTEGMSGPAVRSLQESLATLRIYDGDVDSVFDVDVVNSVKLFQSAYGYEVDGIASTTLQKAAYYEAGKVKAMFSMDGGYDFEKIDEEIYMGKVNCKIGVRLRKKATVKSDALDLLKLDDVVVARERGDEWSQVQRGRTVGYVMTQYVDFYPQNISSLKYTSANGDRVYTIGYTAEDYFSGADRPADIFAEYLASGGSLTDYEGLSDFATVTTASEDITLNLREAPNTDSTILAALTNGTQTKVVLRSTEWTLVECAGQQGYLLNKYLEFWSGPDDAIEEAEEEIEEPDPAGDKYAIEHAAVSNDGAEKAPVYEEDSADATVLGSLKNGTRVDVLQTIEGWCLISYQDHKGYMLEEDLQFINEGLPV